MIYGFSTAGNCFLKDTETATETPQQRVKSIQS